VGRGKLQLVFADREKARGRSQKKSSSGGRGGGVSRGLLRAAKRGALEGATSVRCMRAGHYTSGGGGLGGKEKRESEKGAVGHWEKGH